MTGTLAHAELPPWLGQLIEQGQAMAPATGLSPASCDGLAALGKEALRQQRPQDACGIFMLLTVHAPCDADYRYRLARAQQAVGALDEALLNYALAVLFGGMSPWIDLRSVECLMGLGRWAEARDKAQAAQAYLQSRHGHDAATRHLAGLTALLEARHAREATAHD